MLNQFQQSAALAKLDGSGVAGVQVVITVFDDDDDDDVDPTNGPLLQTFPMDEQVAILKLRTN